jgi:hypothetical protein
LHDVIVALRALGLEAGVVLLEGVGDVLKEDKPEHDVLVLGGIHPAAQGVGHLPELGFAAEVRSRISRRGSRTIFPSRHPYLAILILPSMAAP